MADDEKVVRESVADEATLINDPDRKAEQEAANALCQVELAERMIGTFLDPERPFRLRPSHLLQLQRAALNGISQYAGNFRPAGIGIQGSRHQPIDGHLVPEKIEELCDYVNDNWADASPIHLAAYVLWKINWIHPFTDGNGRTARAASHMVMCTRLGYTLPGTTTIPDQIVNHRDRYYAALEAADEAKRKGCINVTDVENMLSDMLAHQLVHMFNSAKGA